ncbi:MAG TPA: hypothetical protein VGJ96_11255 [Gemmatimonadaceae bacterium]|jgi:hypothetical protein
MPASSPRTIRLLVVFTLLVAVGCGPAEQKTAEVSVVATPPAELPPFQQEIASIKAEATFPGVWKYGYRMIDHPDTTFGGYRAVEFHYTADSAAGVPPRLLLVIRAYKKAAWEKARAAQKDKSKVIAEHGGDVFTWSIVTASPYPIGTASTIRVDQMMLALIAETTPFKLTFK